MRAGVTKRSQRILGWNERFLLVMMILDDVLFRNFRERERGVGERERIKIKVCAVLKA